MLEHPTMARQFHVVPPKLRVAPQNAMMSNNLQVRMRNPSIILYATGHRKKLPNTTSHKCAQKLDFMTCQHAILENVSIYGALYFCFLLDWISLLLQFASSKSSEVPVAAQSCGSPRAQRRAMAGLAWKPKQPSLFQRYQPQLSANGGNWSKGRLCTDFVSSHRCHDQCQAMSSSVWGASWVQRHDSPVRTNLHSIT